MTRVDESLLMRVVAIARAAGAVALRHRDAAATEKRDGSPVTAADLACDALIRRELAAISSHPIVSEETAADDSGAPGPMFWLVDPLDGTKEFLRGTGEFTVNVALIADGVSVLGVVHAPVLDLTYYAAEGQGAHRDDGMGRERIAVVQAAPPLRFALSRDHVGNQEQELLARAGDSRVVTMGSSLKFCLVAEGAADVYPRFGRTREWDTAAAQCVVEQAGDAVTTLSGERLRYGKPALENGAFLAVGDPSIALPLDGRTGQR